LRVVSDATPLAIGLAQWFKVDFYYVVITTTSSAGYWILIKV